MDHVALLESVGEARSNGKTLRERATGRFYTHELIGRALVRQLAEQLAEREGGEDSISILDPFCGDGRLVAWLLEELARLGRWRHLKLGLWDCDAAAVEEACASVAGIAGNLGFDVINVDSFVGDTFRRAADGPAGFQAVVTNPPWELVKPDHRELSELEIETRSSYTDQLRAFDEFLVAEYPFSQPRRRFAGWGTNLSRVGTEIAVRLTAPNGVCGVVAPSSLFADTNSEALREWLFSVMRVSHITYFPAEARLFESVDVPGLTFVGAREESTASKSHAIRITRYGESRQVLDAGTIQITDAKLAAEGWAIPASLGVNGWQLLDRLSAHPRFAELEGKGNSSLWAGRELDETGRRRWTTPEGAHPLLKGRQVRRFQIVSVPDEFVDPSMKDIPSSTQHVRLAWRDVSRPSQKRRVQATLIEPGIVTGNSLGVAFFRDDNLPRLLALLGLMSSIPFEFQVRSRLATGHVSLSVLRQAHLPAFDDATVAAVAATTFDCLKNPAAHQPRLEAVAAQAFGLTYDAWRDLASTFRVFSDDELAAVEDRWGA